MRWNCMGLCVFIGLCVFFKQKTAYEMRISDWSSDVCSSDLLQTGGELAPVDDGARLRNRRPSDALRRLLFRHGGGGLGGGRWMIEIETAGHDVLHFAPGLPVFQS